MASHIDSGERIAQLKRQVEDDLRALFTGCEFRDLLDKKAAVRRSRPYHRRGFDSGIETPDWYA